MTEEWFSELEYKSIDNTQSEEQRKMIGKKISRDSVTCGTTWKGLRYV